ncbi:MAG: ferredoxin reductase family protein [Candidatus Hodarchaeales archaeon]|jgi:predicted ferric reductase
MCIIPVIALLIGASSLTFLFETGSILYKLGTDRVFLRAGKVIGLIAATLLLLQLVLSARFKFLDRIFALNRMYLFHRINAVTVALLAVVHPLLVFAPEDINNIPVQLKYWPEVLGALLLLFIWLITATGLWRTFLDFHFDRWWLFHRAAAFTAVVLLIFHILYGSETFEEGIARYIVIAAAGLYAVIFGWVKIKPVMLKQKPWKVIGVAKTGLNTYSVEVAPRAGRTFEYIPGQFAFISFQSGSVSPEEHPFTISSTPSRPQSLQFTVRCSGDWTRLIGCLKPADTVSIDGPYGRFSYVFSNKFNQYIMIAGGIGITPMLSMLRYMADRDNRKKVTLIWSNRTEDEVAYSDEFTALKRELEGLDITYLFTRQTRDPHRGGRLNQKKLENILAEHYRKMPVFICGPPAMMEAVRNDMVHIGFLKRLIFTEEFQL